MINDTKNRTQIGTWRIKFRVYEHTYPQTMRI